MKDLTTEELIYALHRGLTKALLERLKATPSAELLSVARAALRDNGLLGMARDEADRRRLRRLYGTYLQQLEVALQVDVPSAAVLQEVRLFIGSQGVGKDLATYVDQTKALHMLSSQDLPFKH